jgi:hypothetical protein
MYPKALREARAFGFPSVQAGITISKDRIFPADRQGVGMVDPALRAALAAQPLFRRLDSGGARSAGGAVSGPNPEPRGGAVH